jgi:arginine utilization regulatory protein
LNYKFLLGAILTYLDEGIIVVDTNADVTFYNEPATSIAGISSEEAVGKNILDIFPDLTKKNSTFYHVLKTRQPMIDHVQTYLNYKNERVTTLTSTIPLLKDGVLIGAIEKFRPFDNVKELSEKIVLLQEELFMKKVNHVYKGNGTRFTFSDIIGEDASILELKSKSKKIADSLSPILVFGDTGTGKELLVQSIHNAGVHRKNKPFIAQNCAAIPDNLLEGILFGTEQGSYTGAKDKPGLFELADGGTIFLDEINSMNIDLQAKLLRILQDGIIRRVGGKNTKKVNVRVIASMNESPIIAVEKNRLRKDLFYRLNVISLEIPPLCKRRSDIPLLIEKFIIQYNKSLNKNVKEISCDCVKLMQEYDWPGNIRELKYTIEGIMNFVDNDKITVQDLPAYINSFKADELYNDTETVAILPLKESVSKYERHELVKAIEIANGNYAKAARILNIPRQTLYNKIKKFNISINFKIN